MTKSHDVAPTYKDVKNHQTKQSMEKQQIQEEAKRMQTTTQQNASSQSLGLGGVTH